MIFFDTEGLGLYGPLLTIQWSEGDEEPQCHFIWKESVQRTITLIEILVDNEVCAWNLFHDWFHLTKWYNILRRYGDKYGSSAPPDPFLAWECEQEIVQNRKQDCLCLKPKDALDLMIEAGRDRFQLLRKQKPITIRKIPEFCVPVIRKYLETRLRLPRGVQTSWTVSKDTRRPGLVSLRLNINQKAGLRLKYVYSVLTGKEVTYADELFDYSESFGKPYAPFGGNWFTRVHHASEFNPDQLKYALDDVRMLQFIYKEFGYPPCDRDSRLCIATATTYWKGFSIDRTKLIPPVLNDAPTYWKDVLDFLKEKMNSIERLTLINNDKESSSKVVLKQLVKWKGHPVAELAEQVLKKRKDINTTRLLEFFAEARAFFPAIKVAGTFTNRMAGGESESAVSTKGRINPQGIDKSLREIITGADGFDEENSGGDFDGFEVTIAIAVWGSEELKAEIVAGKSIHGLFGACIYNMTYEEVMETHELYKGDYRDKYQMAKNTFFARVYGAAIQKCAETLGITFEEARIGLLRWEKKYKLEKHREALEAEYSMIKDWEWREPKGYVESLFGFKRKFDIEIEVARQLFRFLELIPEPWFRSEQVIRRKDKAQSPGQAVRSAVLSTVFSLQGRITRVAGNHLIQSPGGDICKTVQYDLWDLQPHGVHPLRIRLLNVHDELFTTHKKQIREQVHQTVARSVEGLRQVVPLLGMTFKVQKTWDKKS